MLIPLLLCSILCFAQTEVTKQEESPKQCPKHALGGYAPEWLTGPDKLTVNCPETKVGIGIHNPATTLDVRGIGHFSQRLGVGTTAPLAPLHVDGNGYVNGNLGLSTATPQQRLDVYGNQALRGDLMGYRTGSGVLGIFSNTDHTNGAYLRLYPNSGNKPGNISLVSGGGGSGSIDFFTWNGSTYKHHMVVQGNGQIGIGTGYIPGGYKVAIEGKVICEETRVLLAADWPDYVFAPDYKLPTIAELEQYVKQHQHLPGVLPASEMKNGADVGATMIVLLEKIEEQSLYIIQQQNQLDRLQQEMAELRASTAPHTKH